ncbi:MULTISPECIES: signal peptidase I [Heyndrickxia]|jgi:signal peptidase I|uniref:signal peptidase I n=1 Tax=Heyndrickxia TaxID=2837504 RepID=UPI00039F20AD|nr:signal peptidase I [Heyndrickxia oleronia]MCI1589423.1 signal peptidase I [Heyndrickxia oleronia]MCI1612653.1 signal peptidase I [Heyndrickxia oleronia]MCI1743880.1 signal peptidase I [Heyndrickxia oleronia]MCI1760577.1 signal peptidase I [Heyndrickxia oleronia]
MSNEKILHSEIDIKDVPRTVKREWISWIRFILIIVILYGAIHYTIGIKIVSGDSMNPTIQDRDIVVVSKLFFTPERGDIIVVKDPEGFDIVKRVIGIPNDHVRIKDGIVYINQQVLDEPYIIGQSMDIDEVVVGTDSYFIMGDNRTPGESLDSRDPSIGTISKEQIVGEKLF